MASVNAQVTDCYSKTSAQGASSFRRPIPARIGQFFWIKASRALRLAAHQIFNKRLGLFDILGIGAGIDVWDGYPNKVTLGGVHGRIFELLSRAFRPDP